jgi:hypothetical protein
MVDACTVKTVTGKSANASTGVVTPTYSAALYTGKCKVATFEPHERSPEVGGAVVTVQRYAVHVPVGAFVPDVGQVVTITTCALDANLVGKRFRVVALLHKSLATAYRLGVEEVV